ncbi:DNA polymerase III subunit chi [Methylobacter sp.]|uniref:DNA polymerase III subunit chi n=1 Tax=Methylobacter sp. TaxID=2051955 RepID=UPI0011F993B2|nr:DNA polymerase III subunit chi [Methylobacter sp.]TAK61689.1 MAG: DNA polymerase III subunit chi [Methylobacter sp.]
MAEVSFYILPSESLHDRHLFACKLIEKAYRSGSFCYVLTDNAEQSQAIDDLLWTFRAGSFIPHQIYTGEPPGIAKDGVYAASQSGTGAAIAKDGVYAAGSPGANETIEQVILIGSANPPEYCQKILFNLSAHYPEVSPKTERILEILDNSETTKEAGRDRYRRYQKSGMPITTHKNW